MMETLYRFKIKKINFFIQFVAVISSALFLVLAISSIVLGPSTTEDSIVALFNGENYFTEFFKSSPVGGNDLYMQDNTEESNVLGISRKILDKKNDFPLIVPTSGIAPRAQFLYTGPYGSEGYHEGIDIWTDIDGYGINPPSYYKGNPVYASCDGTVKKIIPENGDVSIICDEIDPIYESKVPSRFIKTLYGHMADKETKDVFIYVKEGQYVTQGTLIGHQGNLSMYAPHNLMVHLHFGIYDVSVNPQKPLNPESYIGVSCTTLNQVFEDGV